VKSLSFFWANSSFSLMLSMAFLRINFLPNLIEALVISFDFFIEALATFFDFSMEAAVISFDFSMEAAVISFDFSIVEFAVCLILSRIIKSFIYFFLFIIFFAKGLLPY